MFWIIFPMLLASVGIGIVAYVISLRGRQYRPLAFGLLAVTVVLLVTSVILIFSASS